MEERTNRRENGLFPSFLLLNYTHFIYVFLFFSNCYSRKNKKVGIRVHTISDVAWHENIAYFLP